MVGAAITSPFEQSVLSGMLVLGGLGVSAVVYRVGQRRSSTSMSVARLAGLQVNNQPGRDLAARLDVLIRGLGASRWWSARRAGRERRRLLPDFVEAVSRSLSAGSSLGRALAEAGDAVGDPFDVDMARLASRSGVGISLVDALDRWADEVGGEDVRLFSTACVLGAESGRGTAEALTGVAEILADRRDVAAEAHSLSSQARASAAMLLALPGSSR